MRIIAYILYAVCVILIFLTIIYARKNNIKNVYAEYKGILSESYEDRDEKKKEYNIYIKGVPLKRKREVSDEEREIFEQVEKKAREAQEKLQARAAEKSQVEILEKKEQEIKGLPPENQEEKTPSEKNKDKTQLLKAAGTAAGDKTEILKNSTCEKITSHKRGFDQTEVLKEEKIKKDETEIMKK